MLVDPPYGKRQTQRLDSVSAGKLVEVTAPDGVTCIYQVCRVSPLENIAIPYDRVLLVNSSTGRLVFKPKHLLVAEVSAKVKTQYHSTGE